MRNKIKLKWCLLLAAVAWIALTQTTWAKTNDFDRDSDVDGVDLSQFGKEYSHGSLDEDDLAAFSADFGTVFASFIPLGFLTESATEKTAATAVSADGLLVVGYSETPLETQAFRWDPQNGSIGLGHLSNQSQFDNKAYGVSADGWKVVGWSESYNVYYGETSVAFQWTAASTISPMPTSVMSSALDVSADGSIKVGWCGSSESWRGSCYWDEADESYSFGPFSGACTGKAACRGQSSAVSADGSTLIGSLITWEYGSQDTNAISYVYSRLTRKTQYIQDLSGGVHHAYYVTAEDISANGQVVVGVSESAVGYHPFRWTAAEGTIGIGQTAGIFSTGVAKATSTDGSIIVGYAFNFNDHRAFIWDADNGIRDLKQALLELGLDEVSDWVLSEATDISADGQSIVGVGVNPAGRTEAWLVRLP